MRWRLIGVLASLLMIAPVTVFARTSPPTTQGTSKTLAPYAKKKDKKDKKGKKKVTTQTKRVKKGRKKKHPRK